MDEEEVYLENDPLAIYLKNENLEDFEIIQVESNQLSIPQPQTIPNRDYKIEETYNTYIEDILKSELLLEEDYDLVETQFLNAIVQNTSKSLIKYILSASVAILGGTFYKLTHFKIRKAILPLCALPAIFNTYQYFKNYLNSRKMCMLLKELKNFKVLIKKSVQIVSEINTTIAYYSAFTMNSSSLNNIHTHFAREFYFLLLNEIVVLVQETSEIIRIVPLKIQNNMRFDLKKEFFTKTDVTLADIKLLSEIYLLVQSDFLKTLGLSFCSYLWKNGNPDIHLIFLTVLPCTIKSLTNSSKILSNEYAILRNYGFKQTKQKIRVPQKYITSPLHYLNSCLHTSELHFQQLLCKSRDLQNILVQIRNIEDDSRKDLIANILEEMDKQMVSSKNMIDTSIKCFNKMIKKDVTEEVKITPETSTQEPARNMEIEPKQMKPDKLLYELYIPKEGLDLSELKIDEERPVFSMKDLDYSGVLLEELKTILKSRNPDIYQEQMAERKTEMNSDSEDEEFLRPQRRDIFRPTQPQGLAENLQTIRHVLNARKNLLECETICEDTFGDNSDDEVFS